MIEDMGCGLVLLGIGLGILDFFIVRLFRKSYPNPEYWSDANFKLLDPVEQQHWQFRKKNYEAFISHRLLKGGGAVIFLGILIVIASRHFQK